MREVTEGEILNSIEGKQKMNSIFTLEIKFFKMRENKLKFMFKARELDNDEILYVLKGNKYRLTQPCDNIFVSIHFAGFWLLLRKSLQ